jgi:hypothetical protein
MTGIGAELCAPELPAVHDRHHQVEQNEAGGRPCVEAFERVAPVPGLHDRVAVHFEQQRQRLAHVAVVVGDQHARHRDLRDAAARCVWLR